MKINIPFTTEEDIEQAIPIVKDELKKNNMMLEDDKLIEFTVTIMSQIYSIGGWYSEAGIREMTNIFIANGFISKL